MCTVAPAAAQTIIDEWADAKAPPPPPLKSVTVDPSHTALLILDIVLPGCTQEKRPSCAKSVLIIKQLLDTARAKSMAVFYTVTSRTTPQDIVKDIAPHEDEHVQKVGTGPDKFVATDLKANLKAKGITTVIVTGSSAEGAVLYTASGAAMRGFKTIVPVDGMSSDALYQMQFTTWELANAPTIPPNVTLTRGDMIHF
jgi:nicotinamidase-related amidase